MRKLDFEQGSPEWLNWRKGRLTSTDAPMLMGVSPYDTPYQGWQRKIGQIQEKAPNAAMERGKRDEPIARDLFIREYGINMTPYCIESTTHNFIGASLDGISDCGKYILEVKSQRPVESIPDFHMFQMQHALLSTDNYVEKCFYISHWEGENITFEVLPDYEWMKNYLPQAKEFWRRVVFFEAPPLSPRDYRNMTGAVSWEACASDYINICDQIKKLEEIKDEFKKDLIFMSQGENCEGAGIKLLKKAVKGRIDYENIPVLKTINLEEHRKPTTYAWTIMLDQK